MKWRDTLKTFLLALWGFILVAGAVLFHGAVLSQLWEWFITDRILPISIGVLQATGMIIMARLVMFQDCIKETDESNPKLYWFLTTYLTPIAFYIAGWLIHLAM